MPTMLERPRSSLSGMGVEATIRARVVRSRNRFWQPQDLTGSPSSVHHTLADLVREGELQHVRKGLYWRGTHTVLGMSPPSTDALVAELAGRDGVGPSDLSAALMLRVSTQVPRRAQVAVPTRVPQGIAAIEFSSRAARSGRRAAKLGAREVALLEVLEGWERLVEIPAEQAWGRLRDLISSGSVRPAALARAAKTEPAVVRGRLRKLLLEAGEAAAAARLPEVDRRTLARI